MKSKWVKKNPCLSHSFLGTPSIGSNKKLSSGDALKTNGWSSFHFKPWVKYHGPSKDGGKTWTSLVSLWGLQIIGSSCVSTSSKLILNRLGWRVNNMPWLKLVNYHHSMGHIFPSRISSTHHRLRLYLIHQEPPYLWFMIALHPVTHWSADSCRTVCQFRQPRSPAAEMTNGWMAPV